MADLPKVYKERVQGRLKRALGLVECTFFGVGVILGAGIYALIGKAAGFSGNMLWFSFLIASLAAVLTALSYAELSSMFPYAGGEYNYAHEAIGRKTAVFLGSIISVNGIISGAAISLGFAGYFSMLFQIPQFFAAIGIIVFLYLVTVAGIRESSVFNIIFTLVEAGGLIFIVAVAIPELGKVNLLEMPPDGYGGLLTGAALCFYAYVGFEDLVKLAEETRNPEKNIPRALILSSIIVIVVYLLVAVVAVNALPWQELSRSSAPLSALMKHQTGIAAGIIIGVIALFSTSNTILTNIIGSSRVLFRMTKKSKRFSLLSQVSPRFQTPVVALSLVAAVMCAFSLIGDITTVALLSNAFIFITFLFVNLCVILLRINRSNLHRPFRIPVNYKNIPLLSLVAIVMILVLLYFNIRGLTG